MWGGGPVLDSLCRVRPSVRPSPLRVRSITPLLMEGFPSNLNDTFTSTRGCAEPMLPMCQLKVILIIPIMTGYPLNSAKNFSPTEQFPQHILPLLPLYNAQWWGYESLTAIVLVPLNVRHGKIIHSYNVSQKELQNEAYQ